MTTGASKIRRFLLIGFFPISLLFALTAQAAPVHLRCEYRENPVAIDIAFGSVMAWVYRYVVGIDTAMDGPGFQHIIIHPHPGTNMPHADGQYDSVYGKIKSEWKSDSLNSFSLKVTIPANASATIYLPGTNGAHVTESGNLVEARRENGSFVVETASGSYEFDVR